MTDEELLDEEELPTNDPITDDVAPGEAPTDPEEPADPELPVVP